MAAVDDLKTASENLTAKTDALKSLNVTKETLVKQIEQAKADVETAKQELDTASKAVQQEAHDLVVAS